MEYAAGRLYVTKNFKEDAKKDVIWMFIFLRNYFLNVIKYFIKAEEMISYIRNEFNEILKNNEWMVIFLKNNSNS